jgi:hypothetical protein
MNSKDLALLDHIVSLTLAGTLRWEATADESEFIASLRGLYPVTIRRNPEEHPDVLTLRNTNGEVLLQISGRDDNRVNALFSAARRTAFNVDKIIDEILSGDEKSKDDLPF